MCAHSVSRYGFIYFNSTLNAIKAGTEIMDQKLCGPKASVSFSHEIFQTDTLLVSSLPLDIKDEQLMNIFANAKRIHILEESEMDDKSAR